VIDKPIQLSIRSLDLSECTETQHNKDEGFNALATKLSDCFEMETTYVRSEKDIVIILLVPGSIR
jgi:hypothetical protein